MCQGGLTLSAGRACGPADAGSTRAVIAAAGLPSGGQVSLSQVEAAGPPEPTGGRPCVHGEGAGAETVLSGLIFSPFKGACPSGAPGPSGRQLRQCGVAVSVGSGGSHPGPALAMWFFPFLGSRRPVYTTKALDYVSPKALSGSESPGALRCERFSGEQMGPPWRSPPFST